MKTSIRAWLGPDPSCSPAGRCQMLLVCVEVYLRSRRVGLKYGTECSIESHTEQDEPLMPAMLTDLQQTSAAQGSSQQDALIRSIYTTCQGVKSQLRVNGNCYQQP